MSQPQELSLLSQASHVLAQAQTVDEVKEIRDKAEAVKAYAHKARLGRSIVIEASLVKLHAERKLGEMLRDAPLADSSRGNQYTGKLSPASEDRLNLEELGISKSDSSRLQQIAKLPHEVFKTYLDQSASTNRQPTTAGLLRLAKSHRSDGQQTDNSQTASRIEQDGGKQGEVVTDLAQLVAAGSRFGTIYADPPWPDDNQATRASSGNHAMSVDAICNEPVAELAQPQSHLHLWTTNAFLLDAMDVIEAWGFEYSSCFVWVQPNLGAGSYWQNSHGLLLLGVRGGLDFADQSRISWLKHPRGKHNQKPDRVREIVQRVSPADYLELYGRRRVAGWTVYGNEVR